MPKTEIIPFGKYKGQPVEALMQDRDYCDWLMAQDWFRERFQPIYTVIVNNFGEPADTPEHNQLQALFTDAEFCRKLVWRLKAAAIARHFESDRESCLEDLRKKREATEQELARHRQWAAQDWAQRPIRQLEDDLKKTGNRIETVEAMPAPGIGSLRTTAQFETSGIDVALEWTLSVPSGSLERTMHVECKPSLGDDYPAILRQIAASHNFGSWALTNVLLVGDGGYTGSGATLAQVKAMFESRKVSIVFLKEVR